MNVTIIADASWCPETKAGGYGYWIACQRGRNTGGGPIRRRVTSSQSAEMMAVVNGVWHGLNNGYILSGDVLLVQTDCLNAIDLFKRGAGRTTEEREVVEFFHTLLSDNALTVSFRHVRGHTNGDTPRTYVNNVCDKTAKKHMRRMRNHLRLDDIRKLITQPRKQELHP